MRLEDVSRLLGHSSAKVTELYYAKWATSRSRRTFRAATQHALNRDLRKLRNGILPKAWVEVEPWVEQWHAEREAAEEGRLAAKTGNMILAHMMHAASPQKPAAVAASLAIPRERAKKSLQRMANDGKLIRTPEGYKLP